MAARFYVRSGLMLMLFFLSLLAIAQSYTLDRNLPVYQLDDVHSKVIITLEKGSEIEIMATKGDFGWIEGPNYSGYVELNNLKKTKQFVTNEYTTQNSGKYVGKLKVGSTWILYGILILSVIGGFLSNTKKQPPSILPWITLGLSGLILYYFIGQNGTKWFMDNGMVGVMTAWLNFFLAVGCLLSLIKQVVAINTSLTCTFVQLKYALIFSLVFLIGFWICFIWIYDKLFWLSLVYAVFLTGIGFVSYRNAWKAKIQAALINSVGVAAILLCVYEIFLLIILTVIAFYYIYFMLEEKTCPFLLANGDCEIVGWRCEEVYSCPRLRRTKWYK